MTYLTPHWRSLAALSALMMLQACSRPAAPPPIKPIVWVSPVKASASAQQRMLTATLQPRVESPVAFLSAGRISSRLVEVGQSVAAGQVLARLDVADLTLGVTAAQEQVKAAQAEADQAQADEQRLARLSTDGSVASADLERQQARLKAASAHVMQAKSQLDLARNRQGYGQLTAPYAGVITQWHAEAGQVVNEGQVVVSMARQGDVEVQVFLPEQMATDVRQWQAHLALPDQAQAGSWPLSLRELSPVSLPAGRVVRARYALGAIPAALRPTLRWGRSAEVHLTSAGQQSGITLPSGALVKRDGAAFVWIANPATGQLHRQTVTVQGFTSDGVILSGLTEGSQVVSVGAQLLNEQMTVRVAQRPTH